MGLRERILLYQDIERLRGYPLIVYFTSSRPGADGRMAGDVIPEFIDQIQELSDDIDQIDLLIESQGGDALVAWRIISLIREKIKEINVLIPYSAFSAATLLCLGANKIIMGKYGCLGPIDPQIKARKKDGTEHHFAYQDIASYLDFAKERAGLTEQAYFESAFRMLCEQVDPSTLGGSQRASSLSLTMAERLLQTHLTDAEGQLQAKTIAKKLNESFFSHGHALGRTEARNIGLNIEDAEDDIERLMWNVHEDISNELQIREIFDPIAIFLRHNDAQNYLRPPPPLHIPAQIPQQTALQILQQYITQQLEANVPDVNVDLTYALLESTRCASDFKISSKVLLMRNPNLSFTANVVKLSSGWEKKDLTELNT